MRIVPSGTLAFGIQLPIQSQSRIYVADWELTAGADDLARVAQAADEAGFFYVGTYDHVAVPDELAPRMGPFWTDPFATLGFLAGVTRRVRLLSHVLVLAYRHPLVNAKALTTIDWLSGGRLVAGVGAGHAEGEFAALGIDFSARGRLLDDSIDVLTGALRDEVPGLSVEPRPIQQPRPPIWVGGSSKAAIRRAARKGDGWIPQGTRRRDLPDAIALLRSERDRAGVADDVDIGANSEPVYVGEPTWDVGKYTISGAPERIAASLVEFKAMGVTNVQLRFPARSCDELVDQVMAFGAEVAPLTA